MKEGRTSSGGLPQCCRPVTEVPKPLSTQCSPGHRPVLCATAVAAGFPVLPCRETRSLLSLLQSLCNLPSSLDVVVGVPSWPLQEDHLVLLLVAGQKESSNDAVVWVAPHGATAARHCPTREKFQKKQELPVHPQFSERCQRKGGGCS